MVVSGTSNSFSIIAGATGAANLTLGSFALSNTYTSASGTVTLSPWNSGQLVRDTATFGNIVLPPCSASTSAPARIFTFGAFPVVGTSNGYTFVPTGTDQIVVQGTVGVSARIAPRSVAVAFELPGLGRWGVLTQTPNYYQKDVFVPAGPDSSIVSDWYFTQDAATGWNVSALNGCFPPTSNNSFYSGDGIPSLRITNINLSWDTSSVGAGNGFTLRLYSGTAPFIAGPPPTLLYTGTMTTVSNGVGFVLNALVPNISSAGYWIRMTNIGTGAWPGSTPRIRLAVSGTTPGSV